MTSLLRFILGLRADRRGISAMEYALLAGAVATVVIAGATQISGGLTNRWQIVNSKLDTAQAGLDAAPAGR